MKNGRSMPKTSINQCTIYREYSQAPTNDWNISKEDGTNPISIEISIQTLTKLVLKNSNKNNEKKKKLLTKMHPLSNVVSMILKMASS